MQSYYAARAPEYDSVYRKPERQPDLRSIEGWLPPRFTGKTVLEIACGTGYWTRFIASSAARIVAVDSAPETMRIARDRVPEGIVQFVAGDAYALPVQLGEFSAAFAGFFFSHVPKARRPAFLLGLGKLLKPGSKVVLLDNYYVEGSSSPIAGQDSEGNTYQTRVLADGSAHRVLKNFPGEAELRASIAGLGESGTFTRWPYFWAFEYVAAKP
ncbi:MAG: methyltransferase domain-containing protein [Deltaproteobacteria bacterium]|nr:methyltransferase domain-containing protein [Deltaproteobacteria bacterium]